MDDCRQLCSKTIGGVVDSKAGQSDFAEVGRDEVSTSKSKHLSIASNHVTFLGIAQNGFSSPEAASYCTVLNTSTNRVYTLFEQVLLQTSEQEDHHHSNSSMLAVRIRYN